MPSLGPRLPLSPPPCLLPPNDGRAGPPRVALLWNCSVLPLFLSNAACSPPFRPHLLMADGSVWGTFLLGVAFRHVICGFYLFFLLVRLPSKIWKLPPDPSVRGFPGVWKLPLLRLPSRDRSPSLALLSLFLSFIFCPISFHRQWAAFLGTWWPSDQKLFCGVCSAFNCSFDEFVGVKVVSFPIPPPS